MSFIKKLQRQPEYIRKMILWAVVIIVGLVLAILWINSLYKGIQKLESQNIIQELNVPKIEMPAINEYRTENNKQSGEYKGSGDN